MSEMLERARNVQKKTAADTTVWINLALLEGLIAEIECLQHRVDVLSETHPARKLRPINSVREQEDTAI